jgi:hypothetical protein
VCFDGASLPEVSASICTYLLHFQIQRNPVIQDSVHVINKLLLHPYCRDSPTDQNMPHRHQDWVCVDVLISPAARIRILVCAAPFPSSPQHYRIGNSTSSRYQIGSRVWIEYNLTVRASQTERLQEILCMSPCDCA